MKKTRLPILLVLFCIFLASCSSGVPQVDYDALEAEYSALQDEYAILQSQYDDIQNQYTDLQTGYEQAKQEIETLTAAVAEAESKLAEEQQARQAQNRPSRHQRQPPQPLLPLLPPALAPPHPRALWCGSQKLVLNITVAPVAVI